MLQKTVESDLKNTFQPTWPLSEERRWNVLSGDSVWPKISSPRGSSQPRDQTCVSCIAGRFSTAESLGEPVGRPRGQTKWKSSTGLTYTKNVRASESHQGFIFSVEA